MNKENNFSSEIARLIIDGLPMGILFCDQEGIIRLVNKAYAALLDKAPNEIIGRAITELIPNTRAAEVIASGKQELGELCQLGQSQPVIVNRLPVKNSYGQVIGMISQALFNDPEELSRLSAKIDQLGRKLSHYKRSFQASLGPRYTFASIISESEVMNKLKRQAKSLSRLDEPILILGQTGSGKELLAHAMHAESPRANGPLVCINCAAIPRDLFESELFGYTKGAFSGARQEGKMGQIELSHNGTLFLDEIGELPPDIQAKLLRVLETRSVCRVGAITAKTVNFRLIAATNRNISMMLKNGVFREDLYYRINTFILEIPPLNERQDDILPIARHILARMEPSGMAFSHNTEHAMRNFAWPGNVRQLHNAVVHAATMATGNMIEIDDFPPETLPSMTSMGKSHPRPVINELADIVSTTEAQAIKRELARQNGNVAATARALNISRATLYEKFRKYGLNANDARQGHQGT